MVLAGNEDIHKSWMSSNLSSKTSFSTIFQSNHDGVWLRQGAQCSL